MIQHGAVPPPESKAKKPSVARPIIPIAPKQKINERLVPREYVLQILDDGHYRPITELEFDLLKQEIPHIAKLFEDEDEIKNMKIPQIDESVPV